MGSGTSVKLPKAVQKQKEELDARIEEAFKDEHGQEPPAVEQPETTSPESSDETYEQKYKTLQGKYDAEIKRMRDEMDALKQSNTVMPALTEQPAMVPEQTPQEYVTEEDVDIFGEDQIELNKRIAEGVAQEQIAPLVEQTHQLREQNFQITLSQIAPDWKQLNEDAGFLKWLGESEPHTNGFTRYDFLQDAYKRHDARSVASFFNGYQAATHVEPDPAPEGIPIPGNTAPLDSPQSIPQNQVHNQIVPDQLPSPAYQDGGGAGQTYTASQVRDHFTEFSKQQNARHMSNSLRAQHEEINRAIREGRVVPG